VQGQGSRRTASCSAADTLVFGRSGAVWMRGIAQGRLVHDVGVKTAVGGEWTNWARRTAEGRLQGEGRRWAHVRGVAAAAERLTVDLCVSGPDGDAVRAAAWLHDVGYAPSLVVSVFQPLDGARFLRAQGVSGVIVSLVAHHTRAVLEAEQRGLAEALAAFAVPPQDLEDVVTFADLTTGPDGLPVSVEDRLAEILRRYSAEDPVHRAVTASSPSLLACAARVRTRLAGAGQPR